MSSALCSAKSTTYSAKTRPCEPKSTNFNDRSMLVKKMVAVSVSSCSKITDKSRHIQQELLAVVEMVDYYNISKIRRRKERQEEDLQSIMKKCAYSPRMCAHSQKYVAVKRRTVVEPPQMLLPLRQAILPPIIITSTISPPAKKITIVLAAAGQCFSPF